MIASAISNFHAATAVPGIAPVDGYTLCAMPEDDGDGFTAQVYFARKHGPDYPVDFHLDISRFSFTPTQARFVWLVRNGFSRRPGIGPWDDRDIDREIAREELLQLGVAS